MISSAAFRLIFVVLPAMFALGASAVAQESAFAAPTPRAANVGGPMADVPAGQLLVVHIPQASRVLDEIDRLLIAVHQEPSANPLRQLVDSLRLNQPLGPDSAVTFCISPGQRRPVRATRVTGLDAQAVVRGGQPDVAGYVHRKNAPAAMVTGDGVVLVGESAALPALARAVRGVRLSEAERETLADVDVLVRIDLALAVSQYEPAYREAHQALAARLADLRQAKAPPGQIALAEERMLAAERLWASAGEVTALSGGLIVNRRGLDARACLAIAPASPLAAALGDHPPLAGELNPPLPQQEFAALGYASFDAVRLAGLLQWITAAAVDYAAAFGPPESRLGAAEIRDLHALFAGLGEVIGERAGFVVPIRPSSEPVLQVDAVVRLKDASGGAMWRGLVPGKLDALAYLVGALWTPAGGATIRTQLDPASPNADSPVDLWRLTATFPPPPEGDEPSASQRMTDALLGPAGLSLWNAAAGPWGVLSVAPDDKRVPLLGERVTQPVLGQAGDDPRTTEALRHALRRSNLVIVFSPSVLSQLVSRTLLVGLGAYGKTTEEIPLVPPGDLATLSVRLAADSLAARLYLPVSELEPVFSIRRTLDLLEGVPAAPKFQAR